ncbi:MAG: RluA family pseudouridine synthase [Phycisphaerales bacterium]|nr:RluA family pseudouridine synthase [Phycisphaerales bacterium]
MSGDAVVNGDLTVIHEDHRFVVVDKPAGMLSVPGKGVSKQDCAAARVRARYPAATGPLVVHRLDMETSGLLVFALDEAAQRELSAQFEQRLVEKAYIALLEGIVGAERGEVRVPIRADIANRPVQIVDFAHGRAAVTRFRVVAREIDRTRICFEPVTGRTHQLRVHAAYSGPAGEEGGDIIGCPILGDPLYGDAGSAARLMLHASELSFLHPSMGRRLAFSSPIPF